MEIQDVKVGLDLFTIASDNLDDEAKEYIQLQKRIRIAKAKKELANLEHVQTNKELSNLE